MKTKRSFRLFNLVIFVVLMLSVISFICLDFLDFQAMAEEQQHYNTISDTHYDLSDDFSDDKVIIVLDKEETLLFKNYTPEDFKEVDCVAVNDLTCYTVDYVRERIFGGNSKIEECLVDVNNFRRILSLELKEKSKTNVLSTVDILMRKEGVFSAQPNINFTTSATVEDPQFANGNQWGLEQISAPLAWDVLTPVQSVIVGVIDSGIDASHPDLTNKIYRSSPHNLSTTLHRDFTDGGVSIVEPTDENGHGTHVAGIIGAQSNNGIGITGVAPYVEFVSLRVFDSNGSGSLEAVANAINYAQQQNIPILNFSGGGKQSYPALESAIGAYEGLFVVAAGNDDNDNDIDARYPTNYNADNIISVGASDSNNKRSDWNSFANLWGLFGGSKSNYGITTVDIFAPGTDILSTYPLSLCSNTGGGCAGGCNGSGHIAYGYHNMSGTSMATPMVTGVAALLLSQNPNLTAIDIKTAILQNVYYEDSLKEYCSTSGVLDANAAITNVFGYVISKYSSEVEIISVNNVGNVMGIIDIPMNIIDGTITSIGSGAFANQIQLTSITLPSTITSIGADAFAGCTSLTSINIPANVTSIGDGAFAGCSSLTNITIPAGVTSIGEGAFAGCSNLNISVNTSNPNYSAQGNILYNKAKTKIIGSGDVSANITIPNTVTEVCESAFSGNTNLQRVDIYGTPVIDDFAFYDCANLDEVYFYSYTVPEIRAGAFSDNIFTVYVPYNKQSTYYTIFSGYTDNIDSIPITVTLKKDGVAYQTIDTYYGADISGVTDPYKEGYTFNYWVDGAGNTYQNGDVWDSTVDLIVEADWTARQFHITFSGYGSEDLDAKPVTYDQAIGALPVISKIY